MFERLMLRKVELWVVGLICVAAFVGMILFGAIARKTADTAEGNKRFGLVGEAALALSMAPENLMRTARMLINGASICDVIHHLRAGVQERGPAGQDRRLQPRGLDQR